ncbi:hypothetical protein N7450_011771 [Penicillium hetheringtonii]|uniref:Major facilitator superfamily (MFS) profile domain-containing protein n=1 Tax=Penicillium hetheringtonii TaxID=911720 RepID=A0AAD6GNK8_9EURO|nr:hypothetical protein N7450_011771 [Penicillium hetheringtonii]
MWLKYKGLRRLNLGIGLMFSTGASTGYIGSLINGLLILPYFSIFTNGLSPSLLGLLVAAGAIGSFVSFIPASYIADILGRRICVCIGSIIVIIVSIVQASIPNQWVFLSTRALAGMGGGIAATAAPLLITELAHPRQRQSATGLYNCTWCVGSISSAIATIATLKLDNSWSWRLPCLLQILYPILQLVGLAIIPESPRWLVSTNKKSEALEILQKYHANGATDNEDVQIEFEQICSLIPLEHKMAEHGWKKFFSSRGHLHMLAICVLVGVMQEWAGNGVISYYLAPILSSIGIENILDQAIVNLSMQIWNFIISSLSALASERYGRRILWLLSTVLMLLFLVTITTVTALYKEKNFSSAGIAAVPLLFLFFGSFDLAYGSLFIAYPAEILPFELRAKGLSLTLLSDSLGAFSNQFANSVAFGKLQWRYYFVFLGSLSFFLVCIYFFFPETKGRTLEEISQIFQTEKQEGSDENAQKS